MLYLVSTPIGHLKDFSFRAIEILNQTDLILCEDTRHSAVLLNHYHIAKPLLSYHAFNEASRENRVLDELQSGKTLAFLSDAGTPTISDPGLTLVRLCIEHSIPYTLLPGPCALIQALVLSGFPTNPFQFVGFLPRKDGELNTALTSLFLYNGTSVCYESPHRLSDLLKKTQELAPQREIVLCRELTKKFEQCVRGTTQTLSEMIFAEGVKGECVLVIGPPPQETFSWEHLSLQEHVKSLVAVFSLSLKDAIKQVALLRGLSKRDVYQAVHKIGNQD